MWTSIGGAQIFATASEPAHLAEKNACRPVLLTPVHGLLRLLAAFTAIVQHSRLTVADGHGHYSRSSSMWST